MPHRLFLAACAAALAMTIASPQPSFALGDAKPEVKTCPKGRIYDGKTGKCVVKTSKAVPDEARADYAYALARADRFTEALEVLDTMEKPDTAKALNYRGYATRKLGRTDEGIGYYLRSVALDPNYPLVREYLGEAYVVKGRLDLAREQLQTIERLCGRTCESYRDLAEAIEDPSKV